MKIIKKGNPWWYGKQFECPDCNAIVELDKTSPKKGEWYFLPNYPKSNKDIIKFSCPMCQVCHEYIKEKK
jgi:predicted RNA-binding Zn-ribbon protein involved in translation (DUF1610 family)